MQEIPFINEIDVLNIRPRNLHRLCAAKFQRLANIHNMCNQGGSSV